MTSENSAQDLDYLRAIYPVGARVVSKTANPAHPVSGIVTGHLVRVKPYGLRLLILKDGTTKPKRWSVNSIDGEWWQINEKKPENGS